MAWQRSGGPPGCTDRGALPLHGSPAFINCHYPGFQRQGPAQPAGFPRPATHSADLCKVGGPGATEGEKSPEAGASGILQGLYVIQMMPKKRRSAINILISTRPDNCGGT
ncbi:hypothetical protein AAFF_G00396330 [Aldrovandia affinis]|uniref:Uncharacterized protein n=1 Tax=Aldrovandia affinis TaxID=143900 RepID=A0AAD7SDD0_9TELE|nr:hypothetical protein AAFF_G00396330 [Aldrovandia affinis]